MASPLLHLKKKKEKRLKKNPLAVVRAHFLQKKLVFKVSIQEIVAKLNIPFT